MKSPKTREYLESMLFVYALMEGESLEFGEHHHAKRCDQCCAAIDRMLDKLPSGQ